MKVFLSKKLFESFYHDNEFKAALLEVLILEESAKNEPESVVFDNLIKDYFHLKRLNSYVD
ncbi:hypothetical protein BFR75_01985 [Acinetobacter pittii]|nr:hypothetical protein BFR75_01985 [Acinetobacter pittii]